MVEGHLPSQPPNIRPSKYSCLAPRHPLSHSSTRPLSLTLSVQLVETDTFHLHCYLAPTGTKFFVTAAPRTVAVEQLLRTVYELYSDYVLKNPFYEVKPPPSPRKTDAHPS